MTFSHPEVAAFVNANFVPAWHNRGPGFFNADLSTERWIFQGNMEAYPTKNICTFFLAPDGKVFHYVAGTYSPDLFLRFLKDALELRHRLYDAAMEPKDGGLQLARKLHEDRVKDMDEGLKRVKQASANAKRWFAFIREFRAFAYRGIAHQHTPTCLHALGEGYAYLRKLHQSWAEAKELPDLESIRYAYLFGNPFTEESAQARRIADPDAEPPKPPQPKEPEIAGAGPVQGDLRGGRLGVQTGIKPPVSLFGGQ